jgi:Zn-finger nucleic acid-binding protein
MTNDVGANPAGLRCPACQVDLVMSERQGVEIDYCPRCRGVWLDRGELDKILERSAVAFAPPQQQAPFRASSHAPSPEDRHDHERDRGRRDEHKHQKQGRRSFLHDLFD